MGQHTEKGHAVIPTDALDQPPYNIRQHGAGNPGLQLYWICIIEKKVGCDFPRTEVLLDAL